MSGASYDSFTAADEVAQCVSVSKTITVGTFLLYEVIQSGPHNFRFVRGKVGIKGLAGNPDVQVF